MLAKKSKTTLNKRRKRNAFKAEALRLATMKTSGGRPGSGRYLRILP